VYAEGSWNRFLFLPVGSAVSVVWSLT
jgi:hypothetical protein